MADTVKIGWQAYLTTGHPLLSGDGRVLATIVGDDSGQHDALCGTSTAAANQAKYGDSAPQGPSPSGRELFTLAAAKHGLTPRDLPPSVSFFKGVRVQPDGGLTFTGSAGPGKAVDLLAELPLIVLIANVPHPVDPRPAYTCGPLRVHAWRSAPTTTRRPALGRHARGAPRLPQHRRLPGREGAVTTMSDPEAVLDPANYAEGTVLDLAGPLADGAIILDEIVPPRAPWSAVVQPRRHPHHRGRRRQPVRRLPALQRP